MHKMFCWSMPIKWWYNLKFTYLHGKKMLKSKNTFYKRNVKRIVSKTPTDICPTSRKHVSFCSTVIGKCKSALSVWESPYESRRADLKTPPPALSVCFSSCGIFMAPFVSRRQRRVLCFSPHMQFPQSRTFPPQPQIQAQSCVTDKNSELQIIYSVPGMCALCGHRAPEGTAHERKGEIPGLPTLQGPR